MTGAGTLLVDDIVARPITGGAVPTVAPVAVPQTTMTGPIALLSDSTNLRIVVDANRNGVIDGGETTYTDGSSFFGVPLRVSTVAANGTVRGDGQFVGTDPITQFRFAGDVILPTGTSATAGARAQSAATSS